MSARRALPLAALLACLLVQAGCGGQLEMTEVNEFGEAETCDFTGNPEDVGGPARDPGWECGDPEPAPFGTF